MILKTLFWLRNKQIVSRMLSIIILKDSFQAILNGKTSNPPKLKESDSERKFLWKTINLIQNLKSTQSTKFKKDICMRRWVTWNESITWWVWDMIRWNNEIKCKRNNEGFEEWNRLKSTTRILSLWPKLIWSQQLVLSKQVLKDFMNHEEEIK